MLTWKDYVDAIGTFFENYQLNYTERVQLYEKKMEHIYYAYQESDVEVEFCAVLH